MTELDNAPISENENAIITIDVNKDFSVGGPGYWGFKNMSPTVTFNFNLNGHTVTANQGNVIQVRTGYKLNVNGADYNGKAGTWIATYTSASMYYAEWSTASVSSTYENGAVKVTLTDKENNEVFTEALTVKVSVPATWTSASDGSEILEIHRNGDGSAYVYVNIVPDTGVVTVSAN